MRSMIRGLHGKSSSRSRQWGWQLSGPAKDVQHDTVAHQLQLRSRKQALGWLLIAFVGEHPSVPDAHGCTLLAGTSNRRMHVSSDWRCIATLPATPIGQAAADFPAL